MARYCLEEVRFVHKRLLKTRDFYLLEVEMLVVGDFCCFGGGSAIAALSLLAVLLLKKEPKPVIPCSK